MVIPKTSCHELLSSIVGARLASGASCAGSDRRNESQRSGCRGMTFDLFRSDAFDEARVSPTRWNQC